MRNQQPGDVYLPGTPVVSCRLEGVTLYGDCVVGPSLLKNKCWIWSTSWWPLPPDAPPRRGGSKAPSGRGRKVSGTWANGYDWGPLGPRYGKEFCHGRREGRLALDGGFLGVIPCRVWELYLYVFVYNWFSIP